MVASVVKLRGPIQPLDTMRASQSFEMERRCVDWYIVLCDLPIVFIALLRRDGLSDALPYSLPKTKKTNI